MKLSISEIREIAQGVEFLEQQADGIRFSRFSPREWEVFPGSTAAECAAGVQLEFVTDGDELYLDCLIRESIAIRSFFAVDVLVEGKPAGSLQNFDETVSREVYADKVFPFGTYTGKFPLGQGRKKVAVLFPHSALVTLRELRLRNATILEPVKRPKVLLAYGDSITQGYDALHPRNTYVRRLADHLDMELFNKGVGGDRFRPELVGRNTAVTPDCITVAYGTNDWNGGDRQRFEMDCAAMLQSLADQYPGVPVYVISPLWRWDADRDRNGWSFREIEEIIEKNAARFLQIRFIRGMDLVPHDNRFFGDGILHPNDEGFACFLNRLVEKIN